MKYVAGAETFFNLLTGCDCAAASKGGMMMPSLYFLRNLVTLVVLTLPMVSNAATSVSAVFYRRHYVFPAR